jgi:hypothetical protein
MQYELKPLGVGGILDQAIRVFKDHFVLFMLIMVCFQMPLNCAYSWLIQKDTPVVSQKATPEEARAALQSQFHNFLVFFPLMLVTLLIATPITNAALVHATSKVYLGKPTGVGESLWAALTRFFPITWTWFLVSSIIFLGFIACIIPGVIFAFRYYLATDVVVIERVSGFAALRRSRELMLSDRTKHYNTAFLLGIILFIINIGIQQGTVRLIPDPLVSAVVATVLQGIGGAFWLIAIVVFYFSCRCRAENFDLVQLAEAVAADSGTQQEVLPPQ